jgi:flagellin-like protein
LKIIRRRGITEIMATVLMVAVTVITGFAVWGYVNGEAGVASRSYGNSVAANVQFLEERFTIVQVGFNTGAVTIYFYNTGSINFQIASVSVYDSAKATIYDIYTSSGVTDQLNSGCSVAAATVESPVIGTGSSDFVVDQGAIGSITLTLPTSSMNASCTGSSSWTAGTTYYVSVTGLYGNTAIYYQED